MPVPIRRARPLRRPPGFIAIEGVSPYRLCVLFNALMQIVPLPCPLFPPIWIIPIKVDFRCKALQPAK
jgi:hypothetical protein